LQRIALRDLITAVESYQAEMPRADAGHERRLRRRWQQMVDAIGRAAGCLDAQPPIGAERKPPGDGVDWDIHPQFKTK
jgi:hypothetical protein